MYKEQMDVAIFMTAAGQNNNEEVGVLANPELRKRLIMEEAEELITAIIEGDIIGIIDGMCDLQYVVLGTAVDMGIQLQPFFDEVHANNMTKVEKGIMDKFGKLHKPTGWQPPRIREILEQQIKAIKPCETARQDKPPLFDRSCAISGLTASQKKEFVETGSYTEKKMIG